MRFVVAAATVVALATLTVGCGGSSSSDGTPTSATLAATKLATTSVAPTPTPTTTPTPTDATAARPPDAGLGPTDLLGYIATPNGAPVVRKSAGDAAPMIDVPAETAFGAPTTFAVVGDPSGDPAPWIQVLLPIRPNGTVGWVSRSSVTLTTTPFRLFVDLADRTLRVEKDGAQVMVTTTAIGTTENPTPPGAAYVTELVDNEEPGGTYGPYAFGLSLHSDTLSEFGGGNGQIGVHGTNQPELIGQAVSHGCVRLTNADVEKLVDLQLPLGVPVFVLAG